MKRTRRLLIGYIILIISPLALYSQEVKVELGSSEIAVNQYFTITVTVENGRLRNYSSFPEIEGLIKRGTSSSSSTSFVNGRMTSTQSIIQNYQPTREGMIRIPSFTMTVNDQQITVQGINLRIGSAVQKRQRRDPFDPFQNFFEPQEPTEFIDVEADAFLALTTDKSEVYVGEGFVSTLAFYVSQSNRADMRFYDLGKQITEIVKKLKPDNCWEENFSIDNISGEPVTIRGNQYTQYKIFQAAYYPLNQDTIRFPSVELTLIKYKVAKNPSFFGRSRQENFETFYSRPKKIIVNELPPHPLKNQVTVGNFRFREKISEDQLKTSQSFNYTFDIVGEGNISSINEPIIASTEDFDFYTPNVKQEIKRANNTVRGIKSFTYYGIPNEPGTYNLGDYVFWIYFNPLREQYDTLRSDVQVMVTGESRKNEYILSNDLGSFYDRIEFEDNTLQPIHSSNYIHIFANIFAIGIIAFTTFLVFKRQS